MLKKIKRKDIALIDIQFEMAPSFYHYLIMDNIGENVAKQYVKTLKQVVKKAVNIGWLVKNPLLGFKCGYVDPDRECLEMHGSLWSGLFNNHMRDLRTLFNAARNIYNDEDFGIVKIKRYPFNKYKIGSAPLTRSRDNSIEGVLLIAGSPVKARSRAKLAKDLYMLSFYLCGMNAVDIYHSNEKWLNNGVQPLKDQETEKGQCFFSVKIIDETVLLIKKYIGELSKRYTNYSGLDTTLSEGMKHLRLMTEIQDLTGYFSPFFIQGSQIS